MTPEQKIRKVKAIYRRWLDDEEFFGDLVVLPAQEFGNVQEVLRNLGSAIAAAKSYVIAAESKRGSQS